MTETGFSQERKALKRRIRREVLAVRDALSKEALRRASCLITERLLGHQWFYRAESLLCYVSYGSELDTHELLREALRLGKRVYVPRVLEDHGMEFFQIGSLEELRPGFHGIPEPPRQDAGIYRDGGRAGDPALGNGQEPREKVLFLMPGVAFDPYGRRLGYGGGYYDRYLAAHPGFSTCSIGIGHRCQLVEELPVEEMDRNPYQVILV